MESQGGQSDMLKKPVRILLLLANFALGIVPSLLFFVWIERNMTLPIIPLSFGWPWVDLTEVAIGWQLGWNLGLVLVFGVIHSFLAQEKTQRKLETVLPPQALRTFFMIVTGVSVLILMGCWQSTGRILWALPFPVRVNYAISILLFWGIFSSVLLVMKQHDSLEFLGFRQIYEPKTAFEKKTYLSGIAKLSKTGFYAFVRHPIYFLTGLAVFITPVMSLDRLFFLFANGLYLIAALPWEEKKLIALFGSEYEAYRKEVPALIPFTKFRARL